MLSYQRSVQYKNRQLLFCWSLRTVFYSRCTAIYLYLYLSLALYLSHIFNILCPFCLSLSVLIQHIHTLIHKHTRTPACTRAHDLYPCFLIHSIHTRQGHTDTHSHPSHMSVDIKTRPKSNHYAHTHVTTLTYEVSWAQDTLNILKLPF